jgi:hypothetical protein
MKYKYINGDVKKITSICSKLTAEELKFILSLPSDKIQHIIGDLLFNCCLNDNIYSRIKKSKSSIFESSFMSVNKEKIFKILQSPSSKRRNHMIQKQIGNGIISLLSKLLIGALPAIFSSVKK